MISSVLRAVRLAIFGGLLAASLALNIAMFVGGQVYAAASAVYDTVTGTRSVATRNAAEIAELSNDLNAERQARRELQDEAADASRVIASQRAEIADLADELDLERQTQRQLRGEVAEVTEEVASQRAINRQLRGEMSELSEDLLLARRQVTEGASQVVSYRGQRMAVSEAVGETADRISNRARISATREIGSMAGEALPWVGTAVIVGVTALELKDLCDTITDMNELKRAFDPSLAPDENQQTVCSMEVPSREELWEAVRSSPQRSWELAASYTPSMEDIRNMEMPDIDWAAYRSAAGQSLANSADAIGSALGSAADSTIDSATGLWEWLNEEDTSQEVESD